MSAPVLFLHSLGGCSAMWQDTATALGPSWRPIFVDAPGHGEAATGTGTGVEAYKDLALAALDAAMIETAHVIGISMGALVAQAIIRDRPERVSSLFLANASAGGTSRTEARSRVENSREAYESQGAQRFAMDYVTSRLAPDVESAVRARYVAWVCRTLPEPFFGTLEDLLSQDFRTENSRVHCRVTVLTGSLDISTTPPKARHLSSTFPAADCVVVEGAGHFACLDRPRQFHKALLRHLESIA